MLPLMSRKQINIVLILEFDNGSFFGLERFFDLHPMDWSLASESY
jgi:hypothetical protein